MRFGDYKSGSRFCQLALTLVDTLNAKEWVARVNCDIYLSSKHWVTHLKNTIEPMKDAHRMAMENGDVGYAGYLACFVCTHSFLMGANLIPLEHDMQSFTDEMVQYSTEASRSTLIVFHQSVLNLLGRSADPIRLTGELMDEDAHIALMKEESNALAETTIYMNDVLLSYWFGDYDRAGEFVDKMKHNSIEESHCFCVYVFFTGLTCFVLAKRSNPKKWVNLGNKSIKKMQKWALHSPSNCLQKLLLLKAEKAVFWGYKKKAIENFKEAIMFAQKHGFLHEEALANERLGLFLVDIEKHELGCKQLARAMELYQKWGAQAKYLHVREQLITLSHAM
jgi:tetratricopeptide (TPR) repeat protein